MSNGNGTLRGRYGDPLWPSRGCRQTGAGVSLNLVVYYEVVSPTRFIYMLIRGVGKTKTGRAAGRVGPVDIKGRSINSKLEAVVQTLWNQKSKVLAGTAEIMIS